MIRNVYFNKLLRGATLLAWGLQQNNPATRRGLELRQEVIQRGVLWSSRSQIDWLKDKNLPWRKTDRSFYWKPSLRWTRLAAVFAFWGHSSRRRSRWEAFFTLRVCTGQAPKADRGWEKTRNCVPDSSVTG